VREGKGPSPPQKKNPGAATVFCLHRGGKGRGKEDGGRERGEGGNLEGGERDLTPPEKNPGAATVFRSILPPQRGEGRRFSPAIQRRSVTQHRSLGGV